MNLDFIQSQEIAKWPLAEILKGVEWGDGLGTQRSFSPALKPRNKGGNHRRQQLINFEYLLQETLIC